MVNPFAIPSLCLCCSFALSSLQPKQAKVTLRLFLRYPFAPSLGDSFAYSSLQPKQSLGAPSPILRYGTLDSSRLERTAYALCSPLCLWELVEQKQCSATLGVPMVSALRFALVFP